MEGEAEKGVEIDVMGRREPGAAGMRPGVVPSWLWKDAHDGAPGGWLG